MFNHFSHLPFHAISVRQPWAWGIVHAGKPVENRHWKKGNPGLNFRGPVAIHAAAGMTQSEYLNFKWFYKRTFGGEVPPAHELVRGAIIGKADVLDIVTAHPSKWFFGPKALVLDEVEAVAPIPCGGALGFFDWRKGLHDKGAVPPAKWMVPKTGVPVAPIVQGEFRL